MLLTVNVLLMRKHNVKPNPVYSVLCIDVASSKHTEKPKLIYDLVQQYKKENPNWEDGNLDFSSY